METAYKTDLLLQASEQAARKAGESFIQEHVARTKEKQQKESEKKESSGCKK